MARARLLSIVRALHERVRRDHQSGQSGNLSSEDWNNER